MSTVTRTSSATPADARPTTSALPKQPTSRLNSFRSSIHPPPAPAGSTDEHAPGFSPHAGAGNSLALPTPSASGSGSNTSTERTASPVTTLNSGSPPGRFAPAAAEVGSVNATAEAQVDRRRTGGVIDLTSSSPPSSLRRQQLPAAALAAGLVLPGSPRTEPNGARASASGGSGARPRRRGRNADGQLRRTDRTEEMTLSSGSDTSDSEYAPPPRRSTAGGASTSAVLVEDSDSDSDVEIVSVGPVRPPAPRQPGFNDVLGSPPPYVVPPGATATSLARARRAARPRRAAAAAAAGYAEADDEDGDAALARAIAAEDLAGSERAWVPSYGYRPQAPQPEPVPRRAGAGAGWGVFSPTGGLGGSVGAQALLDNLRYLQQFAAGGHGMFWPGAGGGAGYGGHAAGAYPPGGWGGAAKVKAAARKYAVRMSHPGRLEAGFARDVVEPPDPDDPAPARPAKKARKGKRGAAAAAEPTVDLEPVCACCLETLRLDGEGAHRVSVLRCGHAVCARCLDDARARCRAIRDAEKRATAPVAGILRGAKGKGKAKAVVVETDEEDGNDDDYDDNAPSRVKGKAKGKARSRADETGVEEDWTTCPVAGCDGKGSDLLATEGWARPFELFA